MENLVEKAKEIIEENIYMTIATASLQGRPWISPVFFAYDNQYNLFWVSNKNALHSSLIKSNPLVAITIFDSKAEQGEADAVYVEAEAGELKDKKDIEHGMRILSNRVNKEEFKVKNADDVIGNRVWRIYRAVPIKIHKLVDGDWVEGQYIDKHVELNLVPA